MAFQPTTPPPISAWRERRFTEPYCNRSARGWRTRRNRAGLRRRGGRILRVRLLCGRFRLSWRGFFGRLPHGRRRRRGSFRNVRLRCVRGHDERWRRRCHRAHAVQYEALAPLQTRVGMRWIEHPWVDDGAGQQRRLARPDRRRRGAEVPLGRCLDAPDTVTPFDDVQIELQNASLRESRLEAPRNDQLLELTDGIARWGQVEVLRKLLRDRAGAADRLSPFEVDLERGANLFDINAVMLPEAAVFRDEHGAFDMGRHARVRYPPLHLPRLAASA